MKASTGIGAVAVAFGLAVALALGACDDARSGAVDAAAPDGASVGSVDAADKGPYPIVLAHGLMGFDELGPLEYFYGIVPAIETQGRIVIAPRVDAIQGPDVRGAQLLGAIEALRARTGIRKVIIIGHSQGGLDARWVAAHAPSWVAAVITVATPHRGSRVADIALGVSTGPGSSALSALADLFGAATAGSESDLDAALSLLSSDGADAFNQANPDAPGVLYFSVAGRSGLVGADACPPSTRVVSEWDDEIDPMSPALLPTAGILSAAELPDTPAHDGLVTIASAMWGDFLGCIPADHLDEVCQIGGDSPGFGNDFDCVSFYRGLTRFLAQRGL